MTLIPRIGTAHGPHDSRLTDKRAIPLPERTCGSGVGWGVLAFYDDPATGQLAQVTWSVGSKKNKITAIAGTPLS